jgi:DNA-binding NarL/FixJ family response regulator
VDLHRDVLILDDEVMVVRSVGRVLKGHHTTRGATSTQEALVLVAARVPDVLLCDFQLAAGTAEDFLREVKARWPALRCVLYSASQQHLWTALVDDGVVDQVLVKPASAAAILAAVAGV